MTFEQNQKEILKNKVREKKFFGEENLKLIFGKKQDKYTMDPG